MCGRYTLFGNWKSALAEDIASSELQEFEDIIDNYNVSPLQSMPVIMSSDHEEQVQEPFVVYMIPSRILLQRQLHTSVKRVDFPLKLSQ